MLRFYIAIVVVMWSATLSASSLFAPETKPVPQSRTPLNVKSILGSTDYPAVDGSVYIRIFKEERTFEIWVQKERNSRYKLYRTYPVCRYSGLAGPKLQEGDGQSPEGFYSITPDRMHADSTYHRAMDIGFPNEYDVAHDRTGSALMIHGNCVSQGCYAMTDRYIDEIYSIVSSAFEAGQPSIPVHIFPFRMNAMNMAYYGESKWLYFWSQLEKGYRLFEQEYFPPEVAVIAGRYFVSTGMETPETYASQ